MLDTTNYDRLRSLKDLSYSDHDIATLQSGKQSVIDSRHELEQVSAQLEEVMSGEALHAAQQELSELNEGLAKKEHLIDAFIEHHDRARESMRRALAAYEELPEQLVDPHTELWVRNERRLFVEDYYVTPEAYLTALREQANRKREQAAAAALTTMNTEIAAQTESLATERGDKSSPGSPTPEASSNYGNIALGAAAGTVAGASALAAARRGLFGSISAQAGATAGAGGAALSGAAGVYRRPPASGPGSRHEPVNDPQALRHLDLYKTPLNPRMSSDGPIGGYLPAQVTDGTDPRWSSEADRSAVPSARTSMSAGILGGVGGAVGAGSMSLINRSQAGTAPGRELFGGNLPLRTGSTSAGGLSTATSISGLTGSAHSTASGGMSATASSATGAANAPRPFGVLGPGGRITPTVGAPGGISPAGAGSVGAGGVNPAGAGGAAAGGLRSFAASGTPGAGAGTPGSGPAAGTPGAPGAYAPGAAGNSSDRKNGKDRVGYQVVRVRDDERRPFTPSEGAGPGNSASMKPIVREDTDDSWE